MNLQDRLTRNTPLIEPLEQRIAPALLVTGANLLVAGSAGSSTGVSSVGGNSVTRVEVLSGDAIVWYDHGTITAISVGPNTALDIWGDVGIAGSNGQQAIPGPIIANLTASGKLSDSDNIPANGLDGNLLLPNNILSITTHPLGPELGSIGNIITGGSVSNLNISGNLEGVYAGTGAFYTGNANPLLNSHVLSGGAVTAETYLDTNPIQPGIQDKFVFSTSNAKTVASSASITNVKIGAGEELQIFAGDGFAGTAASQGHAATPGQPGGSISNITITNAFIDTGLNSSTPSYFLKSGAGGSGIKGGAGGNISSINEVNSTGVVDIIASPGGTGSSGAGGAGGSVRGLNMQSVSSAYTIHAGNGGQGSPGGAGGSVVGVNFGGNELSNGLIVAAPFTGSGVDDILLVDSLSGNMVIEQNEGPGTGFTPVVQDNQTDLVTIAPVGSDPVAAVTYTDTKTGLTDFVIAYKGTDNLGVYINQGGGVFYTQNFSNSVYTGDTVDGTSFALPYAPSQLAVGNFVSNTEGNNPQDIAVLANNAGQTELLTLQGNGLGGFSQLTSMVQLPSNPVSLVTVNDFHGGQYSDLFAGFQTGEIQPLLSTGSTTSAPFNLGTTITDMPGGLLNLDYNYNPGSNTLLALNASGNTINTYIPGPTGALIEIATLNLANLPGVALVAHFVPETQNTAEPIQVLTSVSGGSRLDTWTPEGATYVLTSSVASSESLKNFVPVIEGSTSGVAAVGGSVEHFSFSQAGGSFFDVSLPFSGKKVSIGAGIGGNGVNGTTDIAAGGAGGSIQGMSILAGDITLTAGNGGSSENAPAGAGGVVVESPTLVTITGETIPTIIEADFVLTVTAGTGGDASGSAHGATGGSGGNVQGLDLSLLQGELQVTGGNGGSGSGGAGGLGGSITGIKAVDNGGDLVFAAGFGGAATGSIGNGGAGGSIVNLNYSLTLSNPGTEIAYNVDLTAGYGGASSSATGGAGGSVSQAILALQPPNESVNNLLGVPSTTHTDTDSTLRVAVTAGYGGSGAIGGAGGSVKNIGVTAIYEQVVTVVGASAADNYSFPEVNPVAATFIAGAGGTGSRGAGGAGGAVSGLKLAGISHYDPDDADSQAGNTALVITSGAGGSGATTGGAGGAISAINSQNAQFIEVTPGTLTGSSSTTANSAYNLSGTELSSAAITSGVGGPGATGAGGAGGSISGLSVGVEGFEADPAVSSTGTQGAAGGELTVIAGGGGAGGASGKGGAGGSLSNSTLGCVAAYDIYGLWMEGGSGGTGGLGGGIGGSVSNILLNSPQNPTPGDGGRYDVLSTIILAGNGGGATGSTAIGGTGGSIVGITEVKDVNTAINLIQAGNGGNATATGGLGGSVTSVNTVGLIGQASDNRGYNFGVFETQANAGFFSSIFPEGVPEGVFSGRGGTGATAGLAGNVTSIHAAQIAAIGAAANSSGLFAAAEKVSNITAELIGYDQNGNGSYDNASGPNRTLPSVAAPIDGFLFSVTAATGVVTDNSTLLQGFTFVG